MASPALLPSAMEAGVLLLLCYRGTNLTLCFVYTRQNKSTNLLRLL